MIGQIGITINQPLKAFSFLMFLFAVGYGVGPQFVRGIAKDGVPQALFSVVQCVFCLVTVVVIAKMAGYDMGYAAGLYSGSQTISAAMGLSTDAINRLGLPPDQAKALIDSMPVAYAVSYMFGTMGSAIVIAVLGPEAARHRPRRRLQGLRGEVRRRHEGSGRRRLGMAALGDACVQGAAGRQGGRAAGRPRPRASCPTRGVFVQRIRRDGQILDATADTVLQAGDVVAVAGPREVLVNADRGRRRPRSRTANCWRCRSRASTCW